MKFQYIYLALAVVFSVIYYFICKKKIFDKHVHSKTLIRAMTFNMVINIAATLVFALFMFAKDGAVFEFLLRTPDVRRKAIMVLLIAIYVIELATVIVGARISVKRKGHKNLKLERILVSDFTVTAVCAGLCTVALLLVIFFLG